MTAGLIEAAQEQYKEDMAEKTRSDARERFLAGIAEMTPPRGRSPRRFMRRYVEGPYAQISLDSKREGLPPLPSVSEIQEMKFTREDNA